MRALLIIIGIAALVAAGLVATGLLKITAQPGSLPSVKFEGGAVPQLQADMATISVTTENKTIEVPKVTTEEKTIQVPAVTLETPDQKAAGNTAAPAK